MAQQQNSIYIHIIHKTPTDSEVSLVFSLLLGATEERGESFGLDSYVGKLLIGFSTSILIRYYIYFLSILL
jgi:hypothetical protein